jgi:hypothetical protein
MLWEPQILETICHLSVWCCREYSPRPTVLWISELCTRYIHPPSYIILQLCCLAPGAWREDHDPFLSWLRGLDSAACTQVFENIYSNKWSRTVRQGIMGMLAFCEEILKKSLSCQDSVLDLLRSFSGTSCITTCVGEHRRCWSDDATAVQKELLPPLRPRHFFVRFRIFSVCFENVNRSFLLVRTAYLEHPTYFNSAFAGISVLTTASPGTTHGAMAAFSMISYARNSSITRSCPVQENKQQEHQTYIASKKFPEIAGVMYRIIRW